jgi:5'-methylthioadenosine phosphorylase
MTREMAINYGVIGGTGVYNPQILTNIEELTVETPYGEIPVKVGVLSGKKVAFLARHGQGHAIPPHKINYRGNIMALKQLGVKKILATQAVGSLRKTMAPGHLVLLDQFIDFTKGRIQTFYEGGEAGVLHVDMTQPYCPNLREEILALCSRDNTIHKQGTYVCTEGPRFETPAEIKMFVNWGGDLVGMTSVPEVVLARELGMCYVGIAMVTNYAAGISEANLTHQEVVETMANNVSKLQSLIMDVIASLDEKQDCQCYLANQEAGSLG